MRVEDKYYQFEEINTILDERDNNLLFETKFGHAKLVLQ